MCVRVQFGSVQSVPGEQERVYWREMHTYEEVRRGKGRKKKRKKKKEKTNKPEFSLLGMYSTYLPTVTEYIQYLLYIQ